MLSLAWPWVLLALPLAARDTDISVVLEELFGEPARSTGSTDEDGQAGWIRLLPRWQEASQWLSRSEVESVRSWLVDPAGWVLADSRSGAPTRWRSNGWKRWPRPKRKVRRWSCAT
mgnify:CR=1 FL=1